MTPLPVERSELLKLKEDSIYTGSATNEDARILLDKRGWNKLSSIFFHASRT